MALALALALFVFLSLVVAAYGYRHYVRPAQVLDQVSTGVSMWESQDLGQIPDMPPDRIRQALQWVGEKVPLNPASAGHTRRQLMAAGFRFEAALPVYTGIRLVLAALFGVLSLFLVPNLHLQPFIEKILMAGAAALGWFLPVLGLEQLVDARLERLKHGLPDALDMMVVCVESGSGLDQAIKVVSRELVGPHPDLCRELSLVSLEMRAGVRRAQSLQNLADRTRQPEIRKLVAILIQTDRFGTSIADSLRTHSDFMRVRRRQEAEEKAAKLGVKMLFPIFAFILPAIFVVTIGPAALRIYRDFLGK